jgi:hypothetical protein
MEGYVMAEMLNRNRVWIEIEKPDYDKKTGKYNHAQGIERAEQFTKLLKKLYGRDDRRGNSITIRWEESRKDGWNYTYIQQAAEFWPMGDNGEWFNLSYFK